MKTKQVWIMVVLAALIMVPMALAAGGPRGREGFGGPGRDGFGPGPGQQGPQGPRFCPGCGSPVNCPMNQQGLQGPEFGRGQRQMQRGQGGQGFGPQRPGMGMMGRGPQGDAGGAMGGMDIARHIQMLTRAVELTPEQQDAIKVLVEESRPVAEENKTALQESMKALREAVLEGNVEAVTTCAKTLSEAMTKQALANAELIKEVKGQLTPEQLEKLETLRAQMQERARQRDEQMDNDERPAPEDELADAPQPLRQRQDRPRARRNAQ